MPRGLKKCNRVLLAQVQFIPTCRDSVNILRGKEMLVSFGNTQALGVVAFELIPLQRQTMHAFRTQKFCLLMSFADATIDHTSYLSTEPFPDSIG